MNRHENYVQSWLPFDFAKTYVGDVLVSTVILRPGSTTQVADTMIVFFDGADVAGLTDRDRERGPVEQAQQQHDRWVAKVRQAVQA